MGVKIQVSEPEVVSSFRFYKSPGEGGVHTGRLWTSSGTLITSEQFASETSSGWQEQPLAHPWSIGPGTYVVSVNANTNFAQTLSGLAGGAGTGSLSAPIGANGVFGDAAGTFPTQSFGNSNYFVDVAVTPDTTVPDTTISASPTNPSGSSSASFSFTSSKFGDSFVCALDSPTYTPCTSPFTATGLVDSSHTFQVRATDAVGTDATPATFTWTVDTTPPNTTITSHPASASNSTSASFDFSANEPATFACSLDSTLDADYTSCSSPTYAGLAEGSHTFRVKATDAVNNAGPVTSFTWTIDSVPPPLPSIDSGPAAGSTTVKNVSFGFSDTESAATFEVQIDGGGFGGSTSPKAYTSLADGSHTFAVRALDAYGNTSASVTRTWTVDAVAPPLPSITSGPAAASTSGKNVSFGFSDTEGTAAFEVQLDGGGYLGATSPIAYNNLSDGSHTFAVRAVDAYGNTSASVSRTWTVDAVAPPLPSITSGPAAASTSGKNVSFGFSDTEGRRRSRCRSTVAPSAPPPARRRTRASPTARIPSRCARWTYLATRVQP